MKKILKLVFTLLIVFSFTNNLHAKCNNEELNSWVNSVDVELIEYKKSYFDENDAYIYTGNLNYSYLLALDDNRDDIYMKATNGEGDKLQSEYVLGYNVTAIGCNATIDETNYTINIYGSKDSACPNELLRTIEYTVDSYNQYSKTNYCKENEDDALCKTHLNTLDISEKEFYEKVIQESDVTIIEKKNIFKIILEYLLFILIPVIIIALIFNIKIKNIIKKDGDN